MTRRKRLVKLSKFLALLLRHQPDHFGLELDEEGWVSLPDVLQVLNANPRFSWAEEDDLLTVAREGTGDGKKRFAIEGVRIRALYGHSFDRQITYRPVEPPPRLYHGTSPAALPAIREQGLQPMGRQYVHLSPDRKTALSVGARHAAHPVVVVVRAADAHDAGVSFYQPEAAVYLADHIPARFLDLPE